MSGRQAAADPLAGRTALVTGAGNGLGRAISLCLVENGVHTILVGRDRSKLAAVAAEAYLSAPGLGDPIIETCDVSDSVEVAALADRLGGVEVSILVNNAGIAGPVRPLTEITPEEWDEVFAVNVRSIYLMCHAFLPAMVSRGAGDVINIASVSGKRPLVNRTPYAASKMAVLGLTATLAFETGPSGINVNTLSPGPVDGARMQRNFRLAAELAGTTYEAAEQEFVSRAALGRMVTEREVGLAAVAMLRMPGLCGADIDLSAGMIAR